MSIFTSLLTGGSNSHQESSETANGLATDMLTAGVVGALGNTSGVAPMTGNWSVNAQGTPDMTVAVGTGVAYVNATPTSQNAQNLRIRNSASSNVTIPANATGSTKFDWIYIKLDAAKAANPAADASDVATLVTSRSSSATTDNGTPPTYGLVLAVVTVANGAASITNGNIRDARVQATMTAVATVNNGWTTLGYTPNTVVYNGNRSYTLTYNSVDLTPTISNGMRTRYQRTTAAPTQCTSLNGTTQYYSKTSPAGMTFTDDFTCMAWVKLTSYAAGTIIGRATTLGTNGFALRVLSTGQVALNAGITNTITYQSLPLNKWVHIAIGADLSGSSYTPYFDGVAVPTLNTFGASSFTQSGNLTVGAYASGTEPFPGKIAQAAVFSAVLTQSTIQSYISQGLVGTETSLISAYSFNNSINDLNTTSANNLTANGSAVATNADSPFAQGATAGSLEYGIVMANSFSTNTTLTVQVPEGSAIPTSGGVSAVSYSSNFAPYGFPKISSLNEVASALLATTANASGTSDTAVSALTFTVTPNGVDSFYLELFGSNVACNPNAGFVTVNIKQDGSVLTFLQTYIPTGGASSGLYIKSANFVPTNGSHTYTVSIAGSALTARIDASTASLCYLRMVKA